jgi:hypothetical protein
MCLLPELHAARSRPRAALIAHGPGPIGPGRAGGDGRFARYYETTSNLSIIPGTRKVAFSTLTSADRGGYAAFRKRAFRDVLTLSPTPSVPLGHHHLTQRGSVAQASLCFRSCIEAHNYPTPPYLVNAVRYSGGAIGSSSSCIGAGLCRILDVDFREFLFHALR